MGSSFIRKPVLLPSGGPRECSARKKNVSIFATSHRDLPMTSWSRLYRVIAGLGRLTPMYAPLHRWFDRRWVRQADAVWTFSEAYGDWCKALYQRPDVVCIPPGIDFDYFSSGDPKFLSQKWGIADGTITLVTVNKLIPRKNIDIFIKVVRWLRDEGYPVKGIIAGNGPARSQLEALAHQEDVMNEIVFAGYVTGRGITPLLRWGRCLLISGTKCSLWDDSS